MKRSFRIAVFVGMLTLPMFGQGKILWAGRYVKRCSDPNCNRCQQKGSCQKQVYQKAPGAPQHGPHEPQQGPAQQPGGYYAAPPQTGTVAGGTSSTGIDGFALHFPALTLKMPTLQLPSLFQMRTNPRMLIDPAQAPYVQQAPVAHGAPIAIQAVPGARQSQPQGSPEKQDDVQRGAPTQKPNSGGAKNDSPEPPSPSDVGYRVLQQQLMLRERQIATLDQRLNRLAESLETVSCKPQGGRSFPVTGASNTRHRPSANNSSYTISRLPSVDLQGTEVKYESRAKYPETSQANGQLVQHVREDKRWQDVSAGAAEAQRDHVARSDYLQPLVEPRRLTVVGDIPRPHDEPTEEKGSTGYVTIALAALSGGLLVGIGLLLIRRTRPRHTIQLITNKSDPTRVEYVPMVR